ncbi:hypothetical protein AVEN_168711-1 [Araneus ventricosus]|uniref:Uncharacterized protein n=1 Tax=Araneus ventricosus TaxID=182803 RepID=A0A4Y2P059_ARAVE|nr:hypothetical protein AVEN_168711-1 [Araneus ventricosus]
MKSRGSSLTEAQELGQRLKKIGLKISASVRCYYFWNAKPCNPTVIESPCNRVRQLVTHRKSFRPPSNLSITVSTNLLPLDGCKRSHHINVYATKSRFRQSEGSQ